jgi:hypothetical protein
MAGKFSSERASKEATEPKENGGTAAKGGKTGSFGVAIADPAVKPRDTTTAAIRRAVRKAAEKTAARKQ